MPFGCMTGAGCAAATLPMVTLTEPPPVAKGVKMRGAAAGPTEPRGVAGSDGGLTRRSGGAPPTAMAGLGDGVHAPGTGTEAEPPCAAGIGTDAEPPAGSSDREGSREDVGCIAM
mmetsp:Transcript_129457/g.374928  ORF Transcript_129457/g.374928 Transcript_129457/m.374928 type:complete len:115 (-) Transcript_129457:116-460(-)